MVNKPRTIGTQGENRGVMLFSRFWKVAPLGHNQKSNDISGGPVPIEVKRHGTLRLGEWTRTAIAAHGPLWFLLLVPRNRTTKTPIPTDLVVMTFDQLYDLIVYQAPDSPYRRTT